MLSRQGEVYLCTEMECAKGHFWIFKKLTDLEELGIPETLSGGSSCACLLSFSTPHVAVRCTWPVKHTHLQAFCTHCNGRKEAISCGLRRAPCWFGMMWLANWILYVGQRFTWIIVKIQWGNILTMASTQEALKGQRHSHCVYWESCVTPGAWGWGLSSRAWLLSLYRDCHSLHGHLLRRPLSVLSAAFLGYKTGVIILVLVLWDCCNN